jgi:hypothetical protein
LRQVCGVMGGKRKLIDLFVIGGDYDSAVTTRWEATNAQGGASHMGSLFRVQKGLIVEWYDTPNDPGAVGPAAASAPARNGVQDSPACQSGNKALSAAG